MIPSGQWAGEQEGQNMKKEGTVTKPPPEMTTSPIWEHALTERTKNTNMSQGVI